MVEVKELQLQAKGDRFRRLAVPIRKPDMLLQPLN